MPDSATQTAGPVRLKRTPKGKRPQYFSDPAVDKLLNMVVALTAELSVTRDRVDTLERLLEERRVLKSEEVDAYVPLDEKVQKARQERRRGYIRRVLMPVQKEIEEISGKDMPRDAESVIRAVS